MCLAFVITCLSLHVNSVINENYFTEKSVSTGLYSNLSYEYVRVTRC